MKTTGIHPALLIPLIILIFVTSGSSQYRSRGGYDSSYSHCTQNCRSFTGQARYQCIKTCISATKKSRPGNGRRKSKYSQCAEVCKSLKGLNSVKCIRLCMERGTTESKTSPSLKSQKSEMEKNCERRCEALDGTYRYRCIKSCRDRYRK